MTRKLRLSFTVLALFIAAFVSADILVLYNSYGLLLKSVEKDFTLPADWQVIQTSASKWYIESKNIGPRYQIPVELAPGTYTIQDGYLVSENGEVFINTSYGLAKVIEKPKIDNVLRMSEKADVLFQIPGSYRIYYSLKDDVLEQFFSLRAPIDKAYVILSTAPEEQRSVNLAYSKMAAAESAQEVGSAGRKIFVLGNMEGLNNGINIKNKSIKVIRKDVNRINLNYSYTYDWQPADYVVELKMGDELPAGDVYVYGNILGYTVPIGRTWMPDINKEGNIFVSKSWSIYHSWTLTKSTKAGGRIYITGDLNLKGNGLTKIVMYAKGLSNLSISTGTIVKQAADYVEIELNVSGVAKVTISFNYLIE
ncbi:hypothetical protein [Fervidobacterium sp.]